MAQGDLYPLGISDPLPQVYHGYHLEPLKIVVMIDISNVKVIGQQHSRTTI